MDAFVWGWTGKQRGPSKEGRLQSWAQYTHAAQQAAAAFPPLAQFSPKFGQEKVARSKLNEVLSSSTTRLCVCWLALNRWQHGYRSCSLKCQN